MWLPLAALALVLARAVLWRSRSARFFLKMFLFHGWVLLLALLALPLCALRGRDVENMRILRGLLQHVKHLYGIRMAVRGAQHFPPRQPYVVVSNHQSSLDLLGMMEVLPDRCVPIAKRELLYMGAVGAACWLGGIIFIDRKRTHDAISVMAEAAHTMLSQDVSPGVGFPRGDAQPRRLHAALQARSLPPRRPGPGARGPHRHLVLPALLQQAGAALHGRAVRDPGAAPAAHAGAGPRGRPGADGAGARRHAAGLRRALGRAQPHGAAPRPTVTHGCPTAAPRRPPPHPSAPPPRRPAPRRRLTHKWGRGRPTEGAGGGGRPDPRRDPRPDP